MAAQAPFKVIWLRRLILWPLAGLAALALLFLLAAWIGSSIPRNGAWQEPDEGVTIYVETNGVHTALVMPLVTPHKDWRAAFPASDLAAPWPDYTHVSVSWGEREVFLNTPTWGDLTASTAIGAIIGGEALLHVAHYVRPAPAADLRPITLQPEDYRALVRAIDRYVLKPNERDSFPGYYSQDVFYTAPGTYNALNSCNQWTSDMLAAAGVKTGWWTPLEGGVMKWAHESEG